jgi:predicted nucleic acid-binding protein
VNKFIMGRTFVIDACCTLNLLATGRELDILDALDLKLLDTEFASKESLWLWTPPDEEGQRHQEPVSTTHLRRLGLLTETPLDTDELADAFVACVEHINDADASCIALARVLRLPLITDDRKERRIATKLFPELELVSTLDLFHEASANWTEQQRLEVAVALRWRGNFAPPRRDPRADWYGSLLRRAGLSSV